MPLGSAFLCWGPSVCFLQSLTLSFLGKGQETSTSVGTPDTFAVICSYLGRKQVNPEEEVAVEGLPGLVVAGYSYWTLAYTLSLAGARKLLASQPLHRMLPVDEFLPVMFDRHPK